MLIGLRLLVYRWHAKFILSYLILAQSLLNRPFSLHICHSWPTVWCHLSELSLGILYNKMFCSNAVAILVYFFTINRTPVLRDTRKTM